MSWNGATVGIVASGPSLLQLDCDLLHCKVDRVITIGNSADYCPAADLLFHCDGKWWLTYPEKRFSFRGELASQIPEDPKYRTKEQLEAIRRFDLKVWIGRYAPLLSLDQGYIHYGGAVGNSAFQALNIAVLRGARKIVFLGLDCQGTGRDHFFGEHPPSIHVDHAYGEWIKSFGEAAKQLSDLKITVLNATRETALSCFERTTIEDL